MTMTQPTATHAWGIYNRLRMWAVDGTWERVFTALVAQADADEDEYLQTSFDLGKPAAFRARGIASRRM
ncbi:hypothetical protein ACIP2Y_43625 [Streptomyces sviceus]|uniref:hypothetical protein n=1 Tax=Streptomyces sviceus TaxID=285530 RepID=UPI00381D5775